MPDSVRHRLKLWLRSEAALGLTSVVAPPPISDAVVRENVADEREPERAVVIAARPVTGSTSDSDVAEPVAQGAALFPEESMAGPAPTDPAFAGPALSPDAKREKLKILDVGEVSGCVKCRLSATRTNTVFGEGDPDARLFFIGEGPGENEDLQGRPFVGRSGDLLTKMIAAMGLKREQVFIGNIVKCRPPNNREPAPDEVATCTPYLLAQLEIIRPKVIVTLGRPSTQYMLQSKLPMSRLRGQWQSWRGIKLMPTYHPAYVLRNYTEQTRAAVWGDLKQVMVEMNLPGPASRE